MSKQLNLTYKDKSYKLEFTRRTVQQLERMGVVADDIQRKPMTMLPALFAGAFLVHHKRVKQEEINEIYNHVPDKEGLVNKLLEMYAEPMEALFAEPEDESGNVQWEANW